MNTRLRARWKRFARRNRLQGARGLRALAATGLLHPLQPRARHLVTALQGLAEGGCDSELLFMAQAHLWGCWMPLLAVESALAKSLSRRRPLLALAATEPGSGADFSALSCAARKLRAGWRLSGRKSCVTNGLSADLFLVFAREASGAISAFLVESRAGSFRKKPVSLLGFDGAGIAELSFRGTPALARLDAVERGAGFFQHCMCWERALILCTAPVRLRILRGQLLELSAAKRRFGRVLPGQPGFRKRLGEVARLATLIDRDILHAARSLETGGQPALLAIRTKVGCSERFERASRILLQLGGKEAFLAGSPWARNFHEALASSLYSGPNDLLGDLLGRAGDS